MKHSVGIYALLINPCTRETDYLAILSWTKVTSSVLQPLARAKFCLMAAMNEWWAKKPDSQKEVGVPAWRTIIIIIVVIIITRPKPAYGLQGLAGGILGP